jgi:hypothetical protein
VTAVRQVAAWSRTRQSPALAATIRSITELRHQDFDLDPRWIVIDARLVQLGTSDPKRPAETEIRSNAAKLAFDELGAVVGVISEDINHVRIRIAAAIGIAAVFVTQIPLNDLRGLPNMGQWLTVAGVILLMGAAALPVPIHAATEQAAPESGGRSIPGR